MRKMMQWMLAAILICGASVFTSCSSNDDNPTPKPDMNLAEKIIGKWIVADLNGEPCPTNLKAVVTIVSPTKAYGSLSDAYSPVWNEDVEADIKIDGNKMTITAKEDDDISHVLYVTVSSITDKEMILSSDWTIFIDGEEAYHESYGSERWLRVTNDYENAIIGLWEGRSTSSATQEFDDGENHRWEFMADGTFRYYNRVDGAWKLSDDDYANYFVDGPLLCTRWKNTGLSQEENREWWEIESINDDVMKWTALRKNLDGTTYTATFEMVKVPADPIIVPDQPDQAAMFAQNVLSDGRYTPAVLVIGEDQVNYLRLDVANYEEAQAEFLKLLPEGVAETAFEADFYKGLFVESTGYELFAPQQNDIDSIAFSKVNSMMSNAIGIAWIQLTPDLEAALQVDYVIYMQGSNDDDLDNFISCLMELLPYGSPDLQDPTHLNFTLPTQEEYASLVLKIVTTKMMSTAEYLEDGSMRMTLTDSNGKSYGTITTLPVENKPDGPISEFQFDEDLQASIAARIGAPISKISFYLVPADE